MRPSRQQPVPWCWRMAAIPTFRDGRTRCNWTTATRPRAKPCAASCSPQLRLCDGLRCDMAMLILPEVFQRTWGVQPNPSGLEPSNQSGRAEATSSSWPKCTGTLNGRCCSRASTMPMTRPCMTGRSEGTAAGSASTCGRASTTSGTSSASSRSTTTARRRNLPLGGPSGRGRTRLPDTGPAVLPSGAVRGRRKRVSST